MKFRANMTFISTELEKFRRKYYYFIIPLPILTLFWMFFAEIESVDYSIGLVDYSKVVFQLPSNKFKVSESSTIEGDILIIEKDEGEKPYTIEEFSRKQLNGINVLPIAVNKLSSNPFSPSLQLISKQPQIHAKVQISVNSMRKLELHQSVRIQVEHESPRKIENEAKVASVSSLPKMVDGVIVYEAIIIFSEDVQKIFLPGDTVTVFLKNTRTTPADFLFHETWELVGKIWKI